MIEGTPNTEKELLRFVSDSKYREKTLLRARKNEDNAYQHSIKAAQTEKDRLVNLRQQEIDNIENSRWEVYANGQLKINHTEGSVIINNNRVLFTNIKGAELNIQEGFTAITTETSKTKKKPSIGGAVAGGIIGGRAGAVAGGVALNKAKTTSHAYTNSIPTCTHMGVIIDVDGFKQEVVLINREIAKSGKRYLSIYNEAQNVIMKLREISMIPVPKSFIPSNEMPSVKDIEKQIDEADEKLNAVINNKPLYKIPSMYRTKEQSYMTDEEYLNYLQQEDLKRVKETKASKNTVSNSGALSIASMILGILGLLLIVVVIGIIPSIIGLILGIVSITTKSPKRGMAIAGIFTSVFAIALFFAALISVI